MAGFLLCTVLLLIMFNLFYTSSNDKNHNEKHTKDIYNNNYEYEDFDDSVGYELC